MGVNNMKTRNNITVSFGKPITAPCLIPVLHASTPNCISDPFMVDGKEYKVTALSFGTPHGVVVVNNDDIIDLPSLGSSLGNHVLFPQGASIVFIRVINRETIEAQLWQRGKGVTAFTPEAVCVAMVASRMLQKIMVNRANVFMGGYNFEVEWDLVGDVKLTGPAELIQMGDVQFAS
jgi:diaminopimelate epimerase